MSFIGEDEYEDAPLKYKHPICEVGWATSINKIPKQWRRAKRPCPCCGRRISSRMEFATHGDQRPIVITSGSKKGKKK